MTVSVAVLGGLSRAGWVFTYPRDDGGEIVAGYAVYVWPGRWWDGLILHAETECEGLRVDPDGVITWRREGTVLDVVNALLELPRPGARLAPGLATGWRAPRLWLPAVG